MTVLPFKLGRYRDPRAFTADDPRTEKTAGGCWLWLRTIHPKTRYGMVTDGPRGSGSAHKAFYRHLVGEVPDGMVLDHLCRVRHCVNPAHLRVVTQRENLLADGSMALAAQHAAKTACPKCGGEYSFDKNGGRFCKPCQRIGIARCRARYATERQLRMSNGQ